MEHPGDACPSSRELPVERLALLSGSPDGSLIAFVKPDGSIFTVHPDGTGLAKLSLATSSRKSAGDVAWSPDGRKIVFILFTQIGPRRFQEGLGTANAGGSNVQQITVSPTFDHSVDWGSDPDPAIP